MGHFCAKVGGEKAGTGHGSRAILELECQPSAIHRVSCPVKSCLVFDRIYQPLWQEGDFQGYQFLDVKRLHIFKNNLTSPGPADETNSFCRESLMFNSRSALPKLALGEWVGKLQLPSSETPPQSHNGVRRAGLLPSATCLPCDSTATFPGALQLPRKEGGLEGAVPAASLLCPVTHCSQSPAHGRERSSPDR